MSDNLDNIKIDVEQFIDPNGAPNSILAQNHQNILKDILSKVGKYTGSPYIATKEATDLTAGKMSFRGNSFDASGTIQIDFAKLTADLTDFDLVLSNMAQGDLFKFKDYKGRVAFFEFQDYETANNAGNDIYEVDVIPSEGNLAYTYQDTEELVSVFDVFSKTIDLRAVSFSGNVVSLDVSRQHINTATANAFTSYTYSASQVLGANAKIWINTVSQPTFPAGSLQTGGVAWESGVDMDLIIEVEQGRVIYFFLLRDTP